MANILIITKQTGNFFTLDLTVDAEVFPQVVSDQNRLLTHGTLCDFKTANGANLIKKQNIDVTEITVIASGTFTFVSTFELWTKLKEVGFFDGLNSGGSGGTGVDRFDELLDTFPYVGNNGYVPVVNTSQQKLIASPFYNVRNFLDLEDVLATSLIANKMVVVSSDGLGLILVDQPTPPADFLNAVGSFHIADTGTTQTVVTNVPLKLTNNGGGANTTSVNAPYGVSSVWNTSTNQFDFSQLSIGDELVIRIDANLDTTTVDQEFKFYINFAIGSPGAFSLGITEGQFKTTTAFSITEDVSFDISNSNTKDYPAEILIVSDDDATVVLNGFYIAIVRKNINVVDVNTNINLSATQSATNTTIVNSGGDDAILPLANSSLAGDLSPADYIKLQDVNTNALLKSTTIDSYIGKRLQPFDNTTNGFIADRTVDGSVGFIAKNEDDTGTGAIASVSVKGSGSLYTNSGALQHFGANYFVSFLRSCVALYSNVKMFIVTTGNNDIDIRTSATDLASATSKLLIKADGQLAIGVAPTSDESATTVLARKSDGSIVLKSLGGVGTGTVTGTGTVNKIAVWLSGTAIGTSILEILGGNTFKVTGKINATDSIEGSSIIKSGGLSTEFLKADGSVSNGVVGISNITGLLLSTGWVFSATDLWTYDVAAAGIGVDVSCYSTVVPTHNDQYLDLCKAEIYPYTETEIDVVRIFAKRQPTININVSISIFKNDI